MKNFYHGTMRLAGPILFWIAIVIFLFSLIPSLLEALVGVRVLADEYGSQLTPPMVTYPFTTAIVDALYASSIPFIGAMLAWRVDLWLVHAGAAAREPAE